MIDARVQCVYDYMGLSSQKYFWPLTLLSMTFDSLLPAGLIILLNLEALMYDTTANELKKRSIWFPDGKTQWAPSRSRSTCTKDSKHSPPQDSVDTSCFGSSVHYGGRDYFYGSSTTKQGTESSTNVRNTIPRNRTLCCNSYLRHSFLEHYELLCTPVRLWI